MIFNTDEPRLADGNIPMLPVIIEASSDRISPNMLFVTIVSNCNFKNQEASLLSTYNMLLINPEQVERYDKKLFGR